MIRPGWTAVVLLGLCGLSSWLLWRWPSSQSPLDCPPERVRAFDAGFGPPVVRCVSGEEKGTAVPAGAALTLGRKLDLNRSSEEELALLPGIGPKLAKALVEARVKAGAFTSWEEVDAVPGVGASVLWTLQAHAELLP